MLSLNYFMMGYQKYIYNSLINFYTISWLYIEYLLLIRIVWEALTNDFHFFNLEIEIYQIVFMYFPMKLLFIIWYLKAEIILIDLDFN